MAKRTSDNSVKAGLVDVGLLQLQNGSLVQFLTGIRNQCLNQELSWGQLKEEPPVNSDRYLIKHILKTCNQKLIELGD